MSKASATKLDPEAQAAPPPGSRRRRITGAAAFVALVLLSLGELLLPLPDVGGAWAAARRAVVRRAERAPLHLCAADASNEQSQKLLEPPGSPDSV